MSFFLQGITKRIIRLDAISNRILFLWSRFEVYVGKKQTYETVAQGRDHQTGPAAVTRNLKIMLAARPSDGWHVVAIDRFYTSVALAIQLLTMKVYVIGTIQVRRIGYNKEIVDTRGKRPRSVVRGTFQMARCVDIPLMSSLCWMDAKPVHFLATGGALVESTVNRREEGPLEEVSCPQIVRDYHVWMGGVDIANQLRLARYSIQMCIRFRKYYKTIFFGFVDMAITNAYITYTWHMKRVQKKPMSHAQFMTLLHNQLLEMKAEDFADAEESQTPVPGKRQRKRKSGRHYSQLVDDWTGKSRASVLYASHWMLTG